MNKKEILTDTHRVKVTHEEDGSHTHENMIGTGDTVIIQKMYGPWCVNDLRITLDANTLEWVIERPTEIRHGPTAVVDSYSIRYEVVARIQAGPMHTYNADGTFIRED